MEQITRFGGRCVSISDSSGSIHDPDGIDEEKLEYIMDLKNVRRGRIAEYAETYPRATFRAEERPWNIPCHCAFPCATQNELDGEDAKELVKNGCQLVAEGANMPTTLEGTEIFLKNNVLFGPGKAANAGGVAVSGLEMAQNAQHLTWTREEVDAKLRAIMHSIHETVHRTAAEYDHHQNYVVGANIAGFVKVADAMIDQGIV